MVSVILPSFNHAAFVDDAVRSVLDQTFRELELIVIDDGSSDATADIVASIRDPRLSLIRLSRNRAEHPRNLALNHARGSYIAFQNSDDIWLPSKLAAQLEVMEGQGRSCAACFTAAQIVNESGLPASNTWVDAIFTSVNRPPAAWLRHFLDFGNCLPLPSAIVRRTDLTRLGGFRPSLVLIADFDLWIRLAACGEFFILPDPLTKIRIVQDGNLSAPTMRNHRLVQIELATALERYTEPPILAGFNRVFPDLPEMPTPGAKKVAIALHVRDRGQGYWLFADRTVARVMEDARERADAIATHGTEFIHAFLSQRCETELRRGDNGPASERQKVGIMARCRSLLGW